MTAVNKQCFNGTFGTIFQAYQNKTHLFALHRAENTAPQIINIPRSISHGSVEHIYWYALVGMSDTRTTSATLYPRFARMFSDNPSLFQVGTFPKPSELLLLFKKYQIALPRKQIKLFIERKHHLDVIFGGDPLAIYEGIQTIDELIARNTVLAREYGVRRNNLFPGAKRKVFTLLAMFLSEIVPGFTFKELVPIDVWVQSITNSIGALSGFDLINIIDLEQSIRPHMVRVFEPFKGEFGVASATWILGNKGCSNCHRIDMSALCPVYDNCRGPYLRMRHPGSNKLYGKVQMFPTFRQKFTEKES